MKFEKGKKYQYIGTQQKNVALEVIDISDFGKNVNIVFKVITGKWHTYTEGNYVTQIVDYNAPNNLSGEFVEIGQKEQVNNPQHYGGKDNPYEAIKVIHAWDLGFDLGNTVKYIARAGKKDNNSEIQDLEKAMWYLKSRIEMLKR